MFTTVLKKIYQQLLLLAVVALVLVAAYVSAGRQFMPGVAGYSDFLEQEIRSATGLPVSIDSLTGDFNGFNPEVNIAGLSLEVGETGGEDSALFFDRASIIVDVPRSLWQRRWVLEQFIVERLELTLEQNEAGSWSLGEMSAGEGGSADLDDLYQAFRRVSRLDLRDVVINVENNAGDRYRLSNGSATIQNRGQNHFIHINASHDGAAQQIQVSLELLGDELDSVAGSLHLAMPAGDYSSIFRSQMMGDFAVQELLGGANVWVQLEDGQPVESVASLDLEAITLRMPSAEQLTLEAVRGDARLNRQDDAETASPSDGMMSGTWSLALSDLTLTHEDQYWRPFNLQLTLDQGRSLSLRSDAINLSFLADVALNSGMLEANARSELLGFAPGGSLRNVDLFVPLGSGESSGESSDENSEQNSLLSVRGNLDNVEIGSVRGSPNMWGIDGYFEATFDAEAQLASGRIEVESDNYSMNIPNVFTRVWDYDYVNGRLDFAVDLSSGQDVLLRSGIIIAESQAVDGRAQFQSRIQQFADGGRDAELDLIVGASRVDAASKSLYLPDGPRIDSNLRNSMEYLERAIVDGTVHDSAVIFRGKTLPGSDAATKTFQSAFQLREGVLEFSPDWPRLQQLAAAVLTSDNDVDIAVSNGGSLELNMGAAVGLIRRDQQEQTWLTITGDAGGSTQAGLDYLQAAPLAGNLKAAFADWRAGGDFSADIEVLVPLSQPGRQTEVRLEMSLDGNDLAINDLDLALADLNGEVIFDTRTGLEPSTLTGNMFNEPVNIDLSSELANDELLALLIHGRGKATPEDMVAWPQQSGFVRDIFRRADGSFEYEAQVRIDQTGSDEAGTTLALSTDFTGLAFELPDPFAKSAGAARALQLEIGFDESGQRLRGRYGEDVQWLLDLQEGQLASGLVTVGQDRGEFESLAEQAAGGLSVTGSVPRVELEQWVAFLDAVGATEAGNGGFNQTLNAIDIDAQSLLVYGQELPAVGIHIEPDNEQQGWLTELEGDAVAGTALIPYDTDDYLNIELAHLRLPADPQEDLDAGESLVELADEDFVVAERSDPLAAIDPRSLPLMRFSTDEFAIGENGFGSWRFALTPTEEGAEFDDLAFDFRGLRLGLDEPSVEIEQLTPHFSWLYDGNNHRSELTGVLTAGDIGEVLLENGFAASLVSNQAQFVTDVNWPGSPAFFSGNQLSGRLNMLIENGRFLQESGGGGALKLVSIINLSAIMRRLRFSDDLLRRGLAFDEITGEMEMDDGVVDIADQLVISGPSSLYQITGSINLAEETINGEMFVTLPVSDNIPWLGLLTANIPLAVGAYLFDQIFGDQVDSLTSAVYTLQGPWDGLQPEFKQAFGSPGDEDEEIIAEPASEQR